MLPQSIQSPKEPLSVVSQLFSISRVTGVSSRLVSDFVKVLGNTRDGLSRMRRRRRAQEVCGRARLSLILRARRKSPAVKRRTRVKPRIMEKKRREELALELASLARRSWRSCKRRKRGPKCARYRRLCDSELTVGGAGWSQEAKRRRGGQTYFGKKEEREEGGRRKEKGGGRIGEIEKGRSLSKSC